MRIRLTILFIFVIIMAMVSILNATEIRGTTHKKPYQEELISIGQAPIYKPNSSNETETIREIKFDKDWELIDSLYIDAYVRADGYLGIKFDSISHSNAIIYNTGDLTSEATAAVEKSPEWLRAELVNIFSQLSDANQIKWAEIINNAIDPYVDEIAFVIAHSSVTYLSSSYSHIDLPTENATLLYNNASELQYVEIVDYGYSGVDEDYYSTTKYWKITEVPKEIYYWYIVHPRISDEIPAYINPDVVEDPHTNNIANPPTGVFWRDYLYNYADDGYTILSDTLANCPVLWNSSSTVDSSTDNAIAVITNWMKDSMEFTSDAERPHQPVRIYKKHIGRCGEWADLTAAAARIALIPCTTLLSISGDHTWDEFWDEAWIHWEPVNTMINNPFHYENGWGWEFASVFEIRSDGCLSPVTDRYSERVATITIYAFDGNGAPIDGALIMLAVESGTSIYYDNWGYTDNEGKYVFIVGEGRKYYARFDSDIGCDPEAVNSVYLLVENSGGGEAYSFDLDTDGIMPSPDFIEISPPTDILEDYKIVCDFSAPNQVTSGNIIMDDIGTAQFYMKSENGLTNFFMMDNDNFALYQTGHSFDTFNAFNDVENGMATFDIPAESDWYVIFDDKNNLNNPQHITGSVLLYSNPIGVNDNLTEGLVPNSYSLNQNYPNPFNPMTTIAYQLPHTGQVKLQIYNTMGQEVRTLVDDMQTADYYQMIWDGKDEQGNLLGSGIYFYRLCVNQLEEDNSFVQVKKMLLLK